MEDIKKDPLKKPKGPLCPPRVDSPRFDNRVEAGERQRVEAGDSLCDPDSRQKAGSRILDSQSRDKSTEDKPKEDKPKEDKPEEDDLQKKIEELQKQKEEYLTGWQRTRADFLNYKKEEMERIGELLKYSNEEMVLKLLPILDNLEIAEKNLPENLKNDASVKGILQVKKQILEFLKSQGVEEIKSVGERFDPNFHEVIEEVDRGQAPVESTEKVIGGLTPAKTTTGIIVEEVQKGYRINGRLLRPARVKITK